MKIEKICSKKDLEAILLISFGVMGYGLAETCQGFYGMSSSEIFNEYLVGVGDVIKGTVIGGYSCLGVLVTDKLDEHFYNKK